MTDQTSLEQLPWGAESVDQIERSATRVTSSSGSGHMIWRRWGSGVPLVLFHGGYGSWAHWMRNIQALSRHFSVIAPDLPGLGESAAPEPASPETVTDVLIKGLDTVLGKRGTFHLVGFSFGSILSGPVAVRLGRRVRSLTVIGAGGLGLPRPQQFELERVRKGMSTAEIADMQRRNLGLLMLHRPESADDAAVAMQTRNTQAARLKSIGFAPPDWLRRHLPDVQAPLTAIWGEFDATAYPRMDLREQTLRYLRPDAAFHVIRGAGHWVQYEAADAFNCLLIEILQRA